MCKKQLLKLGIYSLLVITFSFASTKETADIEKGFRFGEFKDNNHTTLGNVNKKDIKEILLLILKENKEQTKVQKEIRNILQNEFDPKPKMITLSNGKKCLENEDVGCFKMPMINEVKRIPAISNALQKRDLESVKKKEMWYGKYVTEVLKLSYLKDQAIRELGPKYPLMTRPLGTIDSQAGWDGPILQKHRKNIFLKYLPHFEYNLFLGKNRGLDMITLVPLAYVVRNNPSIKINLVFDSRESKIHWEKQYKNFYTAKHLKALKSFIEPKAFDEFKIYTTPSLFLKDNKNSKDTLIHVGKFVELDLINKTIAYMIENNFIKRNELRATKSWDTNRSEDYIKFYYKNKLGIKYEK